MKKFKEFEIKGNDINGGCTRCEQNIVELCAGMSTNESEFATCVRSFGGDI